MNTRINNRSPIRAIGLACAALILLLSACGDDEDDLDPGGVDVTLPEITGDAPATTMPMSTTMPSTDMSGTTAP